MKRLFGFVAHMRIVANTLALLIEIFLIALYLYVEFSNEIHRDVVMLYIRGYQCMSLLCIPICGQSIQTENYSRIP